MQAVQRLTDSNQLSLLQLGGYRCELSVCTTNWQVAKAYASALLTMPVEKQVEALLPSYLGRAHQEQLFQMDCKHISREDYNHLLRLLLYMSVRHKKFHIASGLRNSLPEEKKRWLAIAYNGFGLFGYDVMRRSVSFIASQSATD